MLNITLSDFLWNRGAYDPARSIEEANRKVAGPAARAKLVEVCARLKEYDPYGWEPGAAAARDAEALAKKTDGLVQSARDLDAALPPGMSRWLGCGALVAARENYLKRLLALPDLAASAAEDGKAADLAVREAGADPVRSVILTPWNFRTKRPLQRHASAGGETRFGVGVGGAIEAVFPTPWPSAAGGFELVVCGLDAGPRLAGSGSPSTKTRFSRARTPSLASASRRTPSRCRGGFSVPWTRSTTAWLSRPSRARAIPRVPPPS
jgi:hypothetical protein